MCVKMAGLFCQKESIINLKNILQIMKHLILLSCFFVSVSYAGMHQKNAFVELTTSGEVASVHMVLVVSGGLGYKYELVSNDYFGYVLANVNIGTSVFTGGLASDEHHILAGKLNLEYGYEFMRDSLFSFGFNISPVVPFASLIKYENQSDRKWSLNLKSTLGIFGNFNINNSFEIAIEGKAGSLALDLYIRHPDKMYLIGPFYPPEPFFEVKGRFYF